MFINKLLKNQSFQGLLIAIAFFFLSIFIYKWYIEETDEYILDNPTNQQIKVKINEKEYIIEPETYEIIPLNKGDVKISAKQMGNIILKDTILKIIKPRAVINPSKSNYFIFNRYYGYQGNADSIMRSKNIVIDNVIYYGDIRKNNNILIDSFYFNLNQELPSVIKNKKRNESRSKIFRKKGFIKYYDENFK